MNYENLLNCALKELPEFKKRFLNEIKLDNIDNESGMHTVFSLVFVPVLCEAINCGKRTVIDQMCSFLEKMETCEDVSVQEVSSFTVLEEIADNYTNSALVDFLKPESMKSLTVIRQYMPEHSN